MGFIKNLSLEKVRVIAGILRTNNIAAKMLQRRSAVTLKQFYSNLLCKLD